MLNKYWFLSGWYIFRNLDEEFHKVAIEQIWECMTASAEIKYLKPIKEEDFKVAYILDKIDENKVLIRTHWSKELYACFLFIKIK